jgi:nucleotide-binding universal stress UspA family protein
MLRTILVALDESPSCEAATTLALEWGARFNARLVGVGIFDKASIVDRFDPAPLGTSSFKQQADRARLAHAQEHLQRSLAKFSERCSAAGIAAETLQDVGGPAECILRNAQRSDVVILGRETYFHFETQEHSDPTLAQVFRRSLRPIVAVPKDLPAGKDVM